MNNKISLTDVAGLDVGRFDGLFKLLGPEAYCLYEHIQHELIVASYLYVNSNESFIIDIEQISQYIGIDVEKLRQALNKLSKLNLIIILAQSTINKNYYIVLVNQQDINRLENELMEKFNRTAFENYIIQNQNLEFSRHESSFAPSTDVIKKLVKEYFKKADSIPILVWTDCDCMISTFEIATNLKFVEIPLAMEMLGVALLIPDFKLNDIATFLEMIIDKVLETMDSSIKERYKTLSQFRFTLKKQD